MSVCELAGVRRVEGGTLRPHRTATHRFRPADPDNPNWAGGRWGLRCTEHIGELGPEVAWEIEPYTGVSVALFVKVEAPR